MFGPFLELVLNAADTAATVVVLLALWDGRSVPGGRQIWHWLGLRRAGRGHDVDRFLREACTIRPQAPAGGDGTAAGAGRAGEAPGTAAPSGAI